MVLKLSYFVFEILRLIFHFMKINHREIPFYCMLKIKNYARPHCAA